MKHDFRTAKQAVAETIKSMNKKDPNWKWKATVQKTHIKIFWSYLEYKGEIPPFIITDGSKEKNECMEEDEFLVLRNEHGEYMTGRLIGSDVGEDGTLEQCAVALMKALQSRVNSTY